MHILMLIVLSTEQLEYILNRYIITVRKCGCRLFYMPGHGTTCNCNIPEYILTSPGITIIYQRDCPLPYNILVSYQYTLSYSAYPAKHYPSFLYNTGVLTNISNRSVIPDYIHNLTMSLLRMNVQFLF